MAAETGGYDDGPIIAWQMIDDEVLVGRIGIKAGLDGEQLLITFRQVFSQDMQQVGYIGLRNRWVSLIGVGFWPGRMVRDLESNRALVADIVFLVWAKDK